MTFAHSERARACLLLVLPLAALAIASAQALPAADTAASKPYLQLTEDGLPGGPGSPEGAACDLARAFIRRDEGLFRRVSVKPPTAGAGALEYAAFLDSMADSMGAERARASPSPNGPKAIGKVFAVRHLSVKGPASYGYAAFGYRDVAFVDVGVFLHDGSRLLNRTLVVQDAAGMWFVHPLPSAFPLLSAGLNDEPPSEVDIAEAYVLREARNAK